MTSIGGEKDSIDRICALWFQNGKYVHSPVQGCQIFLCATYQNRGKYGHKIYQMAANIMAIKYTETVHYGTLKNLPQLDFWSENIPSGNPGPVVVAPVHLLLLCQLQTSATPLDHKSMQRKTV
jgi:hypothetical protein